jgi:hypothetical protein
MLPIAIIQEHLSIGSADRDTGLDLRIRSRATIDHGWRVGICETIRKHSPKSSAKFDSHLVCRRHPDRHPVVGTRAE